MAEARPNEDHRFVAYYEQQSRSDTTLSRFTAVKEAVLRLRQRLGTSTQGLQVADIGCGPGAQSLMWAADGHRVQGIDISEPLIRIARQRAAETPSRSVEFSVGTATRLPFESAQFDVVLVPELLEHLPDWQPSVSEVARVLKPGGVAYFCTTNRLCPVQQEFDLPLYSWYPQWVKRRCERMAVTTHGRWVQFTSFPAVNWFTYYGLRDHLAGLGLDAYDRFDVLADEGSPARRTAVTALRSMRVLRWLGQVCTPYTVAFGVKR